MERHEALGPNKVAAGFFGRQSLEFGNVKAIQIVHENHDEIDERVNISET